MIGERHLATRRGRYRASVFGACRASWRVFTHALGVGCVRRRKDWVSGDEAMSFCHSAFSTETSSAPVSRHAAVFWHRKTYYRSYSSSTFFPPPPAPTTAFMRPPPPPPWSLRAPFLTTYAHPPTPSPPHSFPSRPLLLILPLRERMQTHGKLLGPGRTASLLLKEAGVAGFYRGVLSPMVGTGLIKAAVFGGYGLCQGLVRRATGKGE